MPGADAGVLVMVHAGRENAIAVCSHVTRPIFKWFGIRSEEQGCRGGVGDTAHRGSGGCCRPTALKLIIRSRLGCTPMGARRRKRRI